MSGIDIAAPRFGVGVVRVTPAREPITAHYHLKFVTVHRNVARLPILTPPDPIKLFGRFWLSLNARLQGFGQARNIQEVSQSFERSSANSAQVTSWLRVHVRKIHLSQRVSCYESCLCKAFVYQFGRPDLQIELPAGGCLL